MSDKRKAFGIPLTPNHDNCFGIVVSEYGTLMGRHTSSSYSWLERDLKSKINLDEFDFMFSSEVPSQIELLQILYNGIAKSPEYK